eukprot:c22084_g1_i1 orf=550-1677(-)
MKLVAGSYERYLWGWRVEKKKGQLQPIFSYPAHLGPIKCIASWGSVLATGGADDTIKVFDTNANTDMGTLTHHTGAVTALSFYGSSVYPSNLLSASEDGMVCLWDTDSWLLYKSMKGHKKGVSDLSIHPSGRLCVSVGRDSHINMYDLLKGRHCFTSKLSSEASLIRFSPLDGSTYALVVEDSVVVNNTEDGRPLHTLPHDKRILCTAQEEDGILFTGGEDRIIRAWDTRSAKLAFSITKAHTNRIRGLCVWAADKTSETISNYVASASSDGCIRVWDTRLIKNGDDASPVMEAETKARLTCLVACSVKKSLPKTLDADGRTGEKHTSLTDGASPENTHDKHDSGGTTKRCATTEAEVWDKCPAKKKKKKAKDKK